MNHPTKYLMKTEFVAVTQVAARLQLQLYEIPQRLGVMTLAFVEMDANLRNVVEKTCKSKFFIQKLFYSLIIKKEPKGSFFYPPLLK